MSYVDYLNVHRMIYYTCKKKILKKKRKNNRKFYYKSLMLPKKQYPEIILKTRKNSSEYTGVN